MKKIASVILLSLLMLMLPGCASYYQYKTAKSRLALDAQKMGLEAQKLSNDYDLKLKEIEAAKQMKEIEARISQNQKEIDILAEKQQKEMEFSAAKIQKEMELISAQKQKNIEADVSKSNKKLETDASVQIKTIELQLQNENRPFYSET